MKLWRNSKKNRKAFTLVELLVVIAVIGILIALLFPVFAQALEMARGTTCLTNQKQIGQAMLMYIEDNDEALPPFGDQYPEPNYFWDIELRPYLSNLSIINCPSWNTRGKYYDLQGRKRSGSPGIGVPYGRIFRYGKLYGVIQRSRRLNEMEDPGSVMMLTDIQGGRYMYTPAFWPLDYDYDKDGEDDSNNYLAINAGPFNLADPYRHRGGMNIVFFDGHAKRTNPHSFYKNIGDMWGSGMGG